MRVWRSFRRLVAAAVCLAAVIASSSASLAHGGHAGADVFVDRAVETAGTATAPETAVVSPDGDAQRDGPHRSCGTSSCNLACNAKCASHALSTAVSTPRPRDVVLARLGMPGERLPADPPERRLPKPPRT
jgi:hypothetical protein